MSETNEANIFGRPASVTEDPSNRRRYGGGTTHRVLHLIPRALPEVVSTGSGSPAIVHASDFSLVTSMKPAKPGQILALFASGLGPTRPGVDPGTPFLVGAAQPVNSSVEVRVGNQAAGVLYAGGYPGAIDRYQVNFRIPDTIAAGNVSLKLRVAWIEGPEVQLPIQQ